MCCTFESLLMRVLFFMVKWRCPRVWYLVIDISTSVESCALVNTQILTLYIEMVWPRASYFKSQPHHSEAFNKLPTTFASVSSSVQEVKNKVSGRCCEDWSDSVHVLKIVSVQSKHWAVSSLFIIMPARLLFLRLCTWKGYSFIPSYTNWTFLR